MNYLIQIMLYAVLIANVCSQQFFNTMPPPVKTNFTCKNRDTGFYADIETNCRVYHMCDENGNKFTYYCPAETAFRQEALVCDHAHLVDCSSGRRVSSIEQNVKNEKNDEVKKMLKDGRRSFESLPSARFSFPNQAETTITNEKERKDNFQNLNSDYTRSFRITQDPLTRVTVQQETPKPKQSTFVLSSSVFLRDRADVKKNATPSPAFIWQNEGTTKSRESNRGNKNQNGFSTIFSTPSTTVPSTATDFPAKELIHYPAVIFRPPNLARSEKSGTTSSGKYFITATTMKPLSLRNLDNHEDTRNNKFEMNNEKSAFELETRGRNNSEVDAISKNWQRSDENSREQFKISLHERPPFFNDYFSYSETLRSMQAITVKPSADISRATPAPSVITPGTEFPVFALTGSPLSPNEFEDDPYYPKRSTTTEIYYKLRNLNDDNKSFRSSTRRPWPGNINFQIPEVLPDLNSLDDLVDRRKYFFIPRIKASH